MERRALQIHQRDYPEMMASGARIIPARRDHRAPLELSLTTLEWRGNRENLSSLSPTTLQYVSSGLGCHTCTEPVSPSAANITWLVCAFHKALFKSAFFLTSQGPSQEYGTTEFCSNEAVTLLTSPILYTDARRTRVYGYAPYCIGQASSEKRHTVERKDESESGPPYISTRPS